MSGSDIEGQFADLFDGRRDAYGAEEGGCFRPDSGSMLNSTAYWYLRHLEGDQPMGVYPMVYRPPCTHEMGWCVKWGCVDLDIKTDKKPSGDYTSEDECHIAAVNLQKTLKHFGVTSWIERTRSNARHLWVFASTWVPASVMRRALLVATSVAGVSSREVNPKQETLSEGQVGSYVRLPYPGALHGTVASKGQCIVTSTAARATPQSLGWFVPAATKARTPIATLERIASLYKPKTSIIAGKFSDLVDRTRAARGLNALAKHLYDKPVDQISDRSMHIEAFVRASKDSGLSASETLTLADELAARCGKFDGRRDREDQLRRIVERAWT